jgi:flagellar basal body-associated protein FliL
MKMADQTDKGTRNLLNLVVLLSGLCVLGIIGLALGEYFLWAAKAKNQETKIIEQKPEPGKILDLGSFTVNLADEDASRYVKAEVQIEYSPTNLELDKEVQTRVPQFQDLINSLLGDYKAAELSTSEGKEKFRRDLQLKINETLKFGAVTNIFLTQFAIQ